MSCTQLKEKTGYQLREYSDFVLADEKIWYSSNFFNGLFCQNLINGQVSLIGFFPNEELEQKDLFWKVFIRDKKLLFIPYNAKSICIYDIENNIFENIFIPDEEIRKKYISAVMIEDCVYLFPAFAKKALCFDIGKKKVNELKEFNLFVNSLQIQKKQIFYGIGTTIINDWIYLIIKDTNRIIGYHWKSKKVICKKIMDDDLKLASMDVHEKRLYISVIGKEQLICWNPIIDEEKIVFYNADKELIKKIPVIMICNSKLYFYYLYGSILYESPINQIDFKRPIILRKPNTFMGVKQIFDDIFFIPTYGETICRYDIKKKQISYVQRKGSTSSSIWLRRVYNTDEQVIQEKETISLNDYCDVVAKIHGLTLKKNMVVNTGKDIWEYFRENNI